MPYSMLHKLEEDDIRDLIVCDPITNKGKSALARLGLQNIIDVDTFFGTEDSCRSIYVHSKYSEYNTSKFSPKNQDFVLQSHYCVSRSEFDEKRKYLKAFVKKISSDAPEESPLVILGTSGNGKSIFVNYIIRFIDKNKVPDTNYVYIDLNKSEKIFQLGEVYEVPDENNPLWLICVSILYKFRELIENNKEDLPEIIDRYNIFFVKKGYSKAVETKLFNQIKEFDLDNTRSTKELFFAIKRLLTPSVEKSLENILEITLKLLYCSNYKKKNFIVFDNIEQHIQSSDANIAIPNKSLEALYKCVKNVVTHVETCLGDTAWCAFKAILVYRRVSLKIVTTHNVTMPHENQQDYTGYIDIWNIWRNKKEFVWTPYLKAKYETTQSTQIISILDDIMDDNDLRKGTSYQELMAPMMNGGIRRNAASQAHAVMEVYRICCTPGECCISYDTLIQLQQKTDSTRYFYRKALLEIHFKWMITSIESKNRFEQLKLGNILDEKPNFDRDSKKHRKVVRLSGAKSTLVRRILAYLSHFPDSSYIGDIDRKELMMFDYIPLFDLMRVIFLNPIANNDHNKGQLKKVLNRTDHFIPLAEVLCSMGNLDFWQTRSGPMLILNVDDSRMKQNTVQSFSEILEDIWNNGICDKVSDEKYDDDKYCVRLTEVGKVFLDDIQPSFSFFAALFCSDEEPLFFIKDIDKIKYIIQKVYSSAERLTKIYVKATRAFCGTSTSLSNAREKYLPTYNNSCISFCDRVKQLHSEHLKLYKDYITTNATILDIDNFSLDSITIYIDDYINKYSKWKEENCF